MIGQRERSRYVFSVSIYYHIAMQPTVITEKANMRIVQVSLSLSLSLSLYLTHTPKPNEGLLSRISFFDKSF